MALFDRKPPPSRERTREERERDRAEREARRAARGGQTGEHAVPPPLETPPPAEPPQAALAPAPPAEPAPPVPAPPREEVTRPAPPTPAAQPPHEQVTPAVTPPPSRPAPPAPPPREEFTRPAPPTPPREEVTRAAPPPREEVTRPAPPAPPPARTATEAPRARRAAPVDAPSVVFDEHVSEDWSQVDVPPKRRGRRPGGPPPSEQRTSRRWPLALVVVAVVAILVGGWFVLSLFQPLHGDGGEAVSVSIPRGAGVSQAGDVLAERGVVSSAFFFKLRAKLDGTSDIKPGNYTLREDTSYGDALAALTRGPPPPKTTDITITEGRTITEANRLLKRTSLRGSYAGAVRRSTLLRPQQFGAPRSVRTKEGFLFPATYKIRVGAPVADLVTKQLQTFRKEFAAVDLRYARTKKLTPYDVLIIASMIEREAGVPKDRRLIASVIYNRLNQGIPLGIDATIRYELDNWQRPLRMSELERDTPYNTRLRQGLPPTPIGNPGMASIRAAANPARTGFLYFVVKPCGKGEHSFTKTDAEFQRAVQRYEQERQRQGGSPVDC